MENKRILIVDDDVITRSIHRTALATSYDVITASSGAECIMECGINIPDLVLMDVEMPEMDGYGASKILKSKYPDLPIIFVTSHTDLTDHIKAFECGADDVIVKPVIKDVLLKKVVVAIDKALSIKELKKKYEESQKMALEFLTQSGQYGYLIEYIKKAMSIRGYDILATELVNSVAVLGVGCVTMITAHGNKYYASSTGQVTQLEQNILENSKTMGRIFEMGSKMIINYELVSILLENIPKHSDLEVGRVRDLATSFAEATENMMDVVNARIVATQRAEQMQEALTTASISVGLLKDGYSAMMIDARILLQELIDRIESKYAFLGTNREQEVTISETMYEQVNLVLNVLENGRKYEDKLNDIIHALSGSQSSDESGTESSSGDVELF